METKVQKKVISSQKMAAFLEKLREVPEIPKEISLNSVSSSKKEKFFKKILDEIGPQ